MNQNPPHIVVLGSINLDLVIRCGVLPRPGETVLAESSAEVSGGKGANQAVAASRLGGRVALVGRVGDDYFAERLLRQLANERLDTNHVLRTANYPSGMAVVAVEQSGVNNARIVQRLAGIEKDAPRGGRPAVTKQNLAKRIVDTTTGKKPPNATHWSTRSLAKHLGCSASMVQRVWKEANLQPHRTKTFKLSNDPQFAEKVVDVVGLYLNPPEHAIVLCVDEKTQIQALDRTQKSLPIYPGRLKTMTHDYKRNGTTTLFAALNVAEGHVLASCKSRHRHQEWIEFLKQIDEGTPEDVDLHLIVDNYATHKHPKVQRWLKRHKRFHMHFIPTSSSWLNLVERWFREITQQRIRRGVFHSVPQLEAAIYEYIERHNEEAKGFRWTAKPEEILAKVARAVLNKTPTD